MNKFFYSNPKEGNIIYAEKGKKQDRTHARSILLSVRGMEINFRSRWNVPKEISRDVLFLQSDGKVVSMVKYSIYCRSPMP